MPTERCAAAEARLLARAGAAYWRAVLEAGGAALGAQWVIAHRTASLAAALACLRPLDTRELNRMGVEKVEAGLAASPALLAWWTGTQTRLIAAWQEEALALARALATPPGPWLTPGLFGSGWAEAAAARARAAALGIALANAAALSPVLAPFQHRIRRNVARLGRPARKPPPARRGPRRRGGAAT